MSDAALARFPRSDSATLPNPSVICVGTTGLFEHDYNPYQCTLPVELFNRLIQASRTSGLLDQVHPALDMLPEQNAYPWMEQSEDTATNGQMYEDINVQTQSTESEDDSVHMETHMSGSMGLRMAVAEPGQRTGQFYTLLSNLPWKTQPKDLFRYYAENGTRVIAAEVTEISHEVAFRSKKLAADGSNAVLSKHIMTFSEATQERVAQANQAAAHSPDDLSVYDPTRNTAAIATRNWNGSSCLHYNLLYEPLSLDPTLQPELVANLSAALDLPFKRFPLIRHLPDVSSSSTLAPLPVYTTYMYWTVDVAKNKSKFLPTPPADGLAGVTALHPIEITRLRAGFKLPHLCSAVVDNANKAGTLPELYAVAMRFLADGVSATEATVLFKKPRAALDTAKKMNKCSIGRAHVSAKTGTAFYVV